MIRGPGDPQTTFDDLAEDVDAARSVGMAVTPVASIDDVRRVRHA